MVAVKARAWQAGGIIVLPSGRSIRLMVAPFLLPPHWHCHSHVSSPAGLIAPWAYTAQRRAHTLSLTHRFPLSPPVSPIAPTVATPTLFIGFLQQMPLTREHGSFFFFFLWWGGGASVAPRRNSGAMLNKQMAKWNKHSSILYPTNNPVLCCPLWELVQPEFAVLNAALAKLSLKWRCTVLRI